MNSVQLGIRRYWRHYCTSAGLSKELSTAVMAECEKRGSYNGIDGIIKAAKLSANMSKPKLD